MVTRVRLAASRFKDQMSSGKRYRKSHLSTTNEVARPDAKDVRTWNTTRLIPI